MVLVSDLVGGTDRFQLLHSLGVLSNVDVDLISCLSKRKKSFVLSGLLPLLRSRESQVVLELLEISRF